jgi:putative membrane protein
MIRGIAEIYGLRPTPLSTVKLSRMVMANAALAIVADPAAEGAAEALGGGVATHLTGKLAEGSVSGLRVLRLGLKTMDLVRPVPFRPAERRGILQTLAGEGGTGA